MVCAFPPNGLCARHSWQESAFLSCGVRGCENVAVVDACWNRGVGGRLNVRRLLGAAAVLSSSFAPYNLGNNTHALASDGAPQFWAKIR